MFFMCREYAGKILSLHEAHQNQRGKEQRFYFSIVVQERSLLLRVFFQQPLSMIDMEVTAYLFE